MPIIMPVYGTRPEAIKMAPIIRALQRSEAFECLVAVTGQHRAMLDQVNQLFQIEPQFDLNIIQPRQSLNGIMARTLDGMDRVLEEVSPDAVIVQGDTATSTAGAIAAFNRSIPVIHAEAGLRSGDLSSPFPEEGNRKLTSQIASLHLAPTSTSKRNLLNEGISANDIAVTGNSVIDALFAAVAAKVSFSDQRLEDLARSSSRVLLVTTHRRENQGSTMRDIGRAIANIARSVPDITVVLPVHKNPAVREQVLPPLNGLDNVIITEPLDYGEFTRLMSISHVVLTDSGGVQEEAPSLGKPVLVMRENTERPEAVSAGTVKLVGTDVSAITDQVTALMTDDALHRRMANAVNPYGDGQAAERSVAAIAAKFGCGVRLPDFSSEDEESSLVPAN